MPVVRQMETRNSIRQIVIAILSRHQVEESFYKYQKGLIQQPKNLKQEEETSTLIDVNCQSQSIPIDQGKCVLIRKKIVIV